MHKRYITCISQHTPLLDCLKLDCLLPSAYAGIVLETDKIYYHVYNKTNLANKYLITHNNYRNMFYSINCN